MTGWGNPSPAEYLEKLKAKIGEGGYSVRLFAEGRHPRLRVVNTRATQLTEDIYCDGRCFYWSWAERFAPVTDVAGAAEKVTRVLHAVGASR